MGATVKAQNVRPWRFCRAEMYSPKYSALVSRRSAKPSELTLSSSSKTSSMFLTLVGYFPNITLRSDSSTILPGAGQVPPLSRPLRGKICICYPHWAAYWGFVDQLAEFDQEYDELAILRYEHGSSGTSSFIKRKSF